MNTEAIMRFSLLLRSALSGLIVCLSVSLAGCAMSAAKKGPAGTPVGGTNVAQEALASSLAKPMEPEEAQAMLGVISENWLYGEGLGSTAMTAGTVILFPPYLIWVVGNAALSYSGYEPLSVSRALPAEQGKVWDETYHSIAAAPGRLAAALAGREFRSDELAREAVKKYLPGEAKGGES